MSLARAAATRIFADADYLDMNSTWTLTYEQTYLKLGYSLLQKLFEIQMAQDIGGMDGPFGYE